MTDVQMLILGALGFALWQIIKTLEAYLKQSSINIKKKLNVQTECELDPIVSDETLKLIEEYVMGFTDGLKSCGRSADSVLGDSYWISYSQNLDVHLSYNNKKRSWECYVYPVINRQTGGTKYREVKINHSYETNHKLKD
jgi:hypothetical protein